MTLIKLYFLLSFTFFGVLDRIQKSLEKEDYEKTFELITKGYSKEPKNPGLYFYHAKLFFEKSYHRFNADSATLKINLALAYFQDTSEETKKELLKDGLGLPQIQELQKSIEDYQYQQTLKGISISTINDFFSKYPKSQYEGKLIYKRDSISIGAARDENTVEAYESFINDYPNSIFRAEADSLLDHARFLRLKGKGRLIDYNNFRAHYPKSNHIEEVEEFILKYTTASQSLESLSAFIRSSKTKKWKKRAADVQYYMSSKTDIHPNQDSIQRVVSLSNTKLFSALENGLYGFQNNTGRSQTAYEFTEIQETAKCGLIKDDWLFVKKGGKGFIILKNGSILFEDVDGYHNISKEIGLIKRNASSFVYHKSGYQIMDSPVDSVSILKNGWLKVQKNNKWGIYTLFGLSVANVQYDEIYTLGSFLVFEKDGKVALSTMHKLLVGLEENRETLEFEYEDVELVNDSLLIGIDKQNECLIGKNTEKIIPWGNHKISPYFDGWYLTFENGFQLAASPNENKDAELYSQLESDSRWLALKRQNSWSLIPKAKSMTPLFELDSVKLISPAALVMHKDNRSLIFDSGVELAIDDHRLQTFPNRTDYLLLRKDRTLELYKATGEMVFNGVYDELSFLNDTLLKITKSDKQGVIDIDGNFILDLDFEAIGLSDDLVSTLSKGGIGCYDISNNVFIPSDFEAKVEKIAGYYLTKKDGLFGLMDAGKQNVLDFKFDEIRLWNDSSFLVTENGKKFIIDQFENKLVENIDALEMLLDNEGNRLFSMWSNGKVGLVSSQDGVLLPAEYTEIMNIGDKSDPLFFADQHLSKAGYHVVSYIAKQGKLIFSKAYTETEFELILCDDF